MGWVKGVSGNPAGRVPGSSNVNKYRVLKVFEDFNPLENLKALALRAECEGDWDRYESCNEILAPYFAPKFKSVELTGDAENPLAFNVNIVHKETPLGTTIDNIQCDEDSSAISS